MTETPCNAPPPTFDPLSVCVLGATGGREREVQSSWLERTDRRKRARRVVCPVCSQIFLDRRSDDSPEDPQASSREGGHGAGNPLQQSGSAHQAGRWLRDPGCEVSDGGAAGVSQALLAEVRREGCGREACDVSDDDGAPCSQE